MIRPLTISIFDSSPLSASWTGAATHGRGLIRALAARGHEVTLYEPTASDLARCLEVGARADLVVKACGGAGALDAELEAGVLAQRRPGSLVALWDVDPTATLERLRRDPFDPLRALLPRYDLVLTRGGGPLVVRGYRALGARRCAPLHEAFDPTTHHPVPPRREWAADLSLLADRLPDRERRVEELLLRPAALLPERAFTLGGDGWGGRALPKNVRAAGRIPARDQSAFDCSARAVLVVALARTGWSPTTRLFEAAGAGACLITDAGEGLDDVLTPGREVLVARDGEEVARLLRDLTNADAVAIGSAARVRALTEHTHAHRAREVEAAFEGRAREAA